MRKILITMFVLILMIGCTNYSPKSKLQEEKNTQWINNTKILLNLNRKENGLYGDFTDNIKTNPNIYETYYLLRTKEIFNILEDQFIDANKNYLKNYNAKDLKLEEMIYLYKSSSIVKYSNKDLNDSIKKNIDIKIKELKSYNELNDNTINDIYLLSEVNLLFSNTQKNELSNTLTKIISEIENSSDNKLLRVLYPLNILNSNPIEVNEKIGNRLIARIDSLIKEKNINFWELYQLINLIKNKNNIEKIRKNIINNLETQKLQDMSNFQVLYISELFNMLDKSKLSNKQKIIETRSMNCQILTGGYRELVTESIPLEFTYFAIYIYSSLGGNLDNINDTFDELLSTILKNSSDNPSNINWRHIFSYLQFSNNKKGKEELQKLIKLNHTKNRLEDLSIDQTYYFFKTTEFYDLDIRESDLTKFKKMLKEILTTASLNDHYTYFYYYSDLVHSNLIKPDDALNNKIKKEIKKTESKNNFFIKNNYENLLSTYFILSIDSNLNLGALKLNQEDKQNYNFELENYANIYGGYALVKNEDSDLFATMIGLMLRDKLNNKATPILF